MAAGVWVEHGDSVQLRSRFVEALFFKRKTWLQTCVGEFFAAAVHAVIVGKRTSLSLFIMHGQKNSSEEIWGKCPSQILCETAVICATYVSPAATVSKAKNITSHSCFQQFFLHALSTSSLEVPLSLCSRTHRSWTPGSEHSHVHAGFVVPNSSLVQMRHRYKL